MMQSRFANDAAEEVVRKWLDELVDQWLMFREGDRYLTLAVRKRRANRNTTTATVC
jgi:hypothetical protein